MFCLSLWSFTFVGRFLPWPSTLLLCNICSFVKFRDNWCSRKEKSSRNVWPRDFAFLHGSELEYSPRHLSPRASVPPGDFLFLRRNLLLCGVWCVVKTQMSYDMRKLYTVCSYVVVFLRSSVTFLSYSLPLIVSLIPSLIFFFALSSHTYSLWYGMDGTVHCHCGTLCLLDLNTVICPKAIEQKRKSQWSTTVQFILALFYFVGRKD